MGPERLAGVGDVGLGGAVGVEVGALHAGERAGGARHRGDERGQSAVRIVGVAAEQLRVEAQRAMVSAPFEPAREEIGLGVRAMDGSAQRP